MRFFACIVALATVVSGLGVTSNQVQRANCPPANPATISLQYRDTDAGGSGGGSRVIEFSVAGDAWTPETVRSLSGKPPPNHWVWSRPSATVRDGREIIYLEVKSLEAGTGRSVGISGERSARSLAPDTLSATSEALTIYYKEVSGTGLELKFTWHPPAYTGRQGVIRSLDEVEAEEAAGLRFIQELRASLFQSLNFGKR